MPQSSCDANVLTNECPRRKRRWQISCTSSDKPGGPRTEWIEISTTDVATADVVQPYVAEI
eukprot:7039714-Prymnesium_polylepis.1